MGGFTRFCAIIGLLIAVGSFFFTDSAIKEAAGSAFGIALGALPYILFKVGTCSQAIENQQRIISLLEESRNR
jgi:hypothetical protein